MVCLLESIRLHRSLMPLRRVSRPQVASYIDVEARRWLDEYAEALGLTPSVLVKILIQRERTARWLQKCMSVSDKKIASMSSGSTIQARKPPKRRPRA